MPTTNPRINVTFDPNLNKQINLLAAHEQKPVSRLIKELVIEALENREDFYLSALAQSRDTGNHKTMSHNDAWK